ncbi:conserved hypothetical protein [Ricinus communis]|uniref:Uncharacterized protein n=1 Tax=Ricinus communis TaxID=3988 RepID=B9RGF6_RICCO|nr:conserved hypothetical protein [Ricinus communis]
MTTKTTSCIVANAAMEKVLQHNAFISKFHCSLLQQQNPNPPTLNNKLFLTHFSWTRRTRNSNRDFEFLQGFCWVLVRYSAGTTRLWLGSLGHASSAMALRFECLLCPTNPSSMTMYLSLN